MVFSSYLFIFLFLPIFLSLYGALPDRLKNAFILVASLLFYYFGDHAGLWVLIASIIGNYVFGRLIGARREALGAAERPTLWLMLGIAFNLLVLAYFKYIGFLTRTIDGIAAWAGHPTLVPIVSAALPLGISFFAFQGISYLIDVHRGTIAPSRSLLRFATYKTLFPQLIAGPIVRYKDVANELERRTVSAEQLQEGTKRFIIGFCKKVLIADTVAVTADAIFGLPAEQLTAPIAWLGAIAYALQIYFDFSAYSDMAIGLGLIMGFRFPENFNYPYTSTSVRDFWRRWHMTLSSWFRDYVYIPLGGNRLGGARTYVNLLIVFILTGLWHGAAWTFVVWGLWHGLFLAAERAVDFDRRPMPMFVRRLYVLLAVLFGWVLFRSPSFEYAAGMMQAMLGFAPGSGVHPVGEYLDTLQVLAIAAGVVFSAPVYAWLEQRLSPTLARWVGVPVFGSLFAMTSTKVLSGAYSPFLYFRF
jgi:alginate O-acetyltransferase complex protein AlgI